ncbi:hypothetical protein [Calidifontibacter indicus]|uniref:hypothetical protein n=1 Tax=Calidifontibacter indicus TaxID=419650 RepID=UPI001FEA25A3|nr:hypothetical protein [Calidifontibacter indicus]
MTQVDLRLVRAVTVEMLDRDTGRLRDLLDRPHRGGGGDLDITGLRHEHHCAALRTRRERVPASTT